MLGDDNASLLPGVTVCLKGTETCVLSDQNGRFAIENVSPEGRVVVTTEMEGGTRGEHVVCTSNDQPNQALLVVRLVDPIIECTLWTQPVKYGAGGRIADSGHRSIWYAALRIRDRTGKVVWRGHSNRKGLFRASGLADGNYTLEIEKRSFLPQTVKFPVSYCSPQAEISTFLIRACTVSQTRPN